MSFCSRGWFGELAPPSAGGTRARRLTAVISHCSANVSWVRAFLNASGGLHSAVVVSKCGRVPDWSEATHVVDRNVGRCDHTYAKWIAQNVDRLHPDDVVFFMKDTHLVHQPGSRFQTFEDMYRGALGGFACGTRPRKMSIFHNTTELGGLVKRSYKNRTFRAGTLAEWWRRLELRVPTPFTPVCYGGHFATTGRQLRRVATGTWRAMTTSLATGDNIAEGHYAERTWAALLFPRIPRAVSDRLRSTPTIRTYDRGRQGTLVACKETGWLHGWSRPRTQRRIGGDPGRKGRRRDSATGTTTGVVAQRSSFAAPEGVA